MIDKSQIDFENTIATRLTHPYEDEYTLKENAFYLNKAQQLFSC